MDQVNTGWVYSDYCVLAKQAGGPEKLAENTFNAGYDFGYSEGMGTGVLAGAGAAVVAFAVAKAVKHFRAKGAKKAKLVEEERIKAYMAVVQNEMEADRVSPAAQKE